MKQQLETHPTYYGKDLNVTRYEEGADGVKRRITLDPQPDQLTKNFVWSTSRMRGRITSRDVRFDCSVLTSTMMRCIHCFPCWNLSGDAWWVPMYI